MKLEILRLRNKVLWMEKTKRDVLVITSSIDQTVDYVILKYSHIANFYRVNVDQFDQYVFYICNDHGWRIRSASWDKEMSQNEFHSIYYRKPQFPHLDEFEPEYRGMICQDILTIINGIADSFDGIVLSKPNILRKSENKVYQLLYAQKNDLILPKSFIGNCIKDADGSICDFKTIIKPLSVGKVYRKNQCEIYQTSYFDRYEENISLTPIYLQKYIEKLYEVRLTIINNICFPIKIVSENQLDWRKGYDKNQYSIVDVPNEILNSCKKMLYDFNLKFGAFDFIVDRKGNWIFLEVNPNGQWLWLERALNLKMSEEIVNYLTE